MLIQLSNGDLFAGLSMLVLVLVIVGLITAFSIARARRRGSTTLALDVTRNASFVMVGLTAVGVVMSGLTILGSPRITLTGSTRDWVHDRQDSLLSPVCDDEGLPDGVVLCGSVIHDAPFGPRLTIYLGTVLTLVAWAAIAWAIYNATRRAGDRDPFHGSVSRTFGIVAIIVVTTVPMGQVLDQIGMTLAARSLKWAPDAEVPFALELALWPFAVTVGLFALSAIFRYGRQLQEEAARLQKETEGLV